MKAFFAPILVVLLVGATSFLYFGGTRSRSKAETKRSYKTTPLTPSKRSEAKRQRTDSTNVQQSASMQTHTHTGSVSRTTDALSEQTDAVHTDAPPRSGITVSKQTTDARSNHSEGGPEPSQDNRESEDSRHLLQEAERAIEEAERLQKEGYTVVANQLTSLTVEQQRLMLKQMRDTFIQATDPITEEPVFKNTAEAEAGWQMFLDGIISTGYTPPEG